MFNFSVKVYLYQTFIQKKQIKIHALGSNIFFLITSFEIVDFFYFQILKAIRILLRTLKWVIMNKTDP